MEYADRTRCESYNTAQIQLLREGEETASLPGSITNRTPTTTNEAASLITTPIRIDREDFGVLSRGRSLSGNTYPLPAELESTLEDSASRSDIQALSRSHPNRPVLMGLGSIAPLDSDSQRRSGSMPPIAAERSLARHSSSSSMSAATMEITEDAEDVDDDVDFWGGVSPRERAADEARLRGGSERSPIRFWQSSISRDDDEDDGEDESDDYDDDDESTIDDEDEDDGAEEMFTLAGHR